MSDRSRFDKLAESAERYGRLSLDNYAQIRSIAENLSAGFCRYMGGDGVCVHLVPPEGAWSPQPYQSGAFSVSGSGFLPLAPISFGLAVRVSHSGDWIRLALTCSKAGHDIDVVINDGPRFSLSLPISDREMYELYDHLHAHLVNWFDDQADRYEHGDYGSRDMGFEFVHSDETAEN